jgi:hypothetical protein
MEKSYETGWENAGGTWRPPRDNHPENLVRSELDIDIAALASRLTTAEAAIATLQSELNTAESEIDTLQTDLNTAEEQITEHGLSILELSLQMFTAEQELNLITSGAWTAWTPVITQSTTPTQAIAYATYQRTGRKYTCHFGITFTGAGTANNAIGLQGFPTTAANTNAIRGWFRYFDSGNTNRVGTLVGNTTTTCRFYYDGWGNEMGNTDFAVANGDFIQGTMIFEGAS